MGTVLVRIVDPETKSVKEQPVEDPLPGLPEPVFCTQDGRDGTKSWEAISESGQVMGNDTVVIPLAEDGDKLSHVFINMDSAPLRDFVAKAKSEEAIEFARKRYIGAIYFHTLFLYSTTKSRSYEISKGADGAAPVELTDYISDLFSSSNAQFLINFEASDLMDALG